MPKAKDNALSDEQKARLGVLSRFPDRAAFIGGGVLLDDAEEAVGPDAARALVQVSGELEAMADTILQAGKCRTSAGILSRGQLDCVKSRERYKGIDGRLRNDRTLRRVG